MEIRITRDFRGDYVCHFMSSLSNCSLLALICKKSVELSSSILILGAKYLKIF